MRLDELTFPNQYEEAGKRMQAAGWIADETGLNSLVFYRDDRDYVLKLYDSRDYAYHAFLDLVFKNPNKHFPRIMGKPLKITPAYYAVRMEKLDIVGYGDRVALTTYLISRSHGISAERNYVQYEAHIETMKYLDNNPEMKKALDLIYDNLLPRFNEDLHSGNIMQRSDGTLVIIDPVS